MRKLGYVIVNDDEEYLADYQDRGGVRVRWWARVPDFARVFSTRSKASDVLKKMAHHSRLWILELHETDRQLAVVSGEEKRPEWLNRTIQA